MRKIELSMRNARIRAESMKFTRTAEGVFLEPRVAGIDYKVLIEASAPNHDMEFTLTFPRDSDVGEL